MQEGNQGALPQMRKKGKKIALSGLFKAVRRLPKGTFRDSDNLRPGGPSREPARRLKLSSIGQTSGSHRGVGKTPPEIRRLRKDSAVVSGCSSDRPPERCPPPVCARAFSSPRGETTSEYLTRSLSLEPSDSRYRRPLSLPA